MGASKLTDPERPRLGDDLHKHPLKPMPHAVDPSDGLPRPLSGVSMQDAVAPPLHPETFVCMGDESVFVVRDEWGEIILRVTPDRVRYSHHQDAHVAELTADEMSGHLKFKANAGPVFVEPLRPQCQHYKRVMTPFEHDKVIRQVERVCLAQRGESGEYVSLADQQVLACEHRTPRDFVSEERLRKFDEKRVAEGKKSEEDWDPTEAVTKSLRPKGESHGND